MATYLELYAAAGAGANPALQQQIVVAITIKAELISTLPTPTAAQKAWAVAALKSPTDYLPTVMHFILAQYAAQTMATIQAATDAQVQTAVNSAVDTLLGV